MATILINPNSTEAMTVAMLEAARVAAPGVAFEGWTSKDAPPAIEGAEHGRQATAPLLALVAQADQHGADAIIIGCFDDTALAEAADLARCPVIGIGQAAFHFAALRQWRFGVVTTLPVSVPVIEENLLRYGLDRIAAPVRAAGVPVLTLDAAPQNAIAPIRSEAERAIDEDGAEAIVLGCAGMVHVTNALAQALPVPVIDPVVAAATCVSWLKQ